MPVLVSSPLSLLPVAALVSVVVVLLLLALLLAAVVPGPALVIVVALDPLAGSAVVLLG
ncbi:MAG: hypothetical protein IAG13_37680, partial [Deltaproteobacteria bacterium]|nr:hypothetical protein [Nannocystaceae bacterium]